MLDHEGLTAMELALFDRPKVVDLNPSNPCEAYVWGENSNYNLGIGHDQTRSFPEVSEHLRRSGVVVKSVSMNKFHTLFVDNNGRAYSCGHGTGGRLGLGSQQPQLEPKFIPMSSSGSEKTVVLVAAAAANHSAFLLDNGLVLTCGSNQLGQLGHGPQVCRSM
jgi:alpha-tubulin suppressor-like RCC1 family protein